MITESGKHVPCLELVREGAPFPIKFSDDYKRKREIN
jgi:hypothetical protein